MLLGQPVATHGVAWSDGLSVCLFVTFMRRIEMTCGLVTQVGPKNHVLDGVQIHTWEGALLRGSRSHREAW